MRTIREIARKVLRVREKESINDAVNRHKSQINKKFVGKGKSISQIEIISELKGLNIKKGDTLMVHASWRNLYQFEFSPESLIKILQSLVGEQGTILMPCFGDSYEYFDVEHTPSSAGVLSEVFRKMPNVIRSECSHFSVCGWGKNAKEYLSEHDKSVFGFDEYSPYFKLCQDPQAKILKLGMGKYPIKTTLIHCVEYVYKDVYPYFKDYLSYEYKAIVINKYGEKKQRLMIRGTYAKLYKRNIVSLYKNIPQQFKKHRKIGNIDIVLLEANESFKVLDKMTNNGITMLNPPIKNKYSFRRIQYEKQ